MIKMKSNMFYLNRQSFALERQLRIKIRSLLEEADDKLQSPSDLNFLGLKHVVQSKGHLLIQILWSIAIIVCLALCTYQIHDRICYFFTYPIYIKMTIMEYENISYPAITFCLYCSPKFMKLISSESDNIYCNYDITDFLGKKRLETVEKLWQQSSPRRYIKFLNSFNPFEVNILMEKEVEVSHLKLPQGVCVNFKQKQQSKKYYGTLSVLPVTCTNTEICLNTEIFLNQKESFVNPTMSSKVPTYHVAMQLEMKVFKFEDTPLNPCTTNISSAFECQRNCYESFIEKFIPCHMPYLNKFNSTQQCETITDAKMAVNITMNIYRQIKPVTDCKCIRPCESKDYNVKMELVSEPIVNKWEVTMYFPTNMFEEISEVKAYPFIKLLCDIGGNLGLYLGLSILALINGLQSFVGQIKISKISPK